jgi:hypothetical protein
MYSWPDLSAAGVLGHVQISGIKKATAQKIKLAWDNAKSERCTD